MSKPRLSTSNNTPPRQLISTTKAAEILNVSPNTVRALIGDRKLTRYEVGGLPPPTKRTLSTSYSTDGA